MIALLLATVCAALFSILFKVFKKNSIDTNPAIVYNYLAAVVLSLLFSYDSGNAMVNPVGMEWFFPALAIGVVFIGGMIAMSVCTVRTGVVISTVASRASMVIPILLNFLLIPGSEKPKWVVIGVMILAMSLIIWKKDEKSDGGYFSNVVDIMMPILVFLLFGLCSTFLKLVQYSISSRSDLTDSAINQQLSMVSCTIFISAMIVGLLLVIVDRQSSLSMMFKIKNILGGTALGACNFLSTYLLMVSMKSIDTELLFPVHNVGIVAICAIVGWGLYREKMKPHQIVGFIIAAIAICFI